VCGESVALGARLQLALAVLRAQRRRDQLGADAGVAQLALDAIRPPRVQRATVLGIAPGEPGIVLAVSALEC